MYSSILKYTLITTLTLSGGISETLTAPNQNKKVETHISTNTGKTTTIPIVQNWRSRMQGHDSSITVFVSKTIGLYRKNYEPSDLVPIAGIPEIGEAGRSNKLRKEARNSLWKMAIDFENHFGEPLIVISGYRSASYQQRMWDLGKCTDTLCAPAGYSEHQLGLAVDLFDASTEAEYFENPKYREYVDWLKKNAHKYGWHQSYQKGESVDAYEIEPWHWRYLGIDLATKLHKLEWSFTEYTRFQDLIEWR